MTLNNKVSYLVLTGFLIVGCVKKASEPAPTEAPPAAPPQAAVAPAQTPPPVKSASEEPLAELKTFKPRVSFRRKRELVWEEAQPALPLYRYDALQTHAQAGADVVFVNGSKLDINEETLIIIDPSNQTRKTTDRLVFRGGKMKSSTQKELMILTSAGLIRMNSSNSNHPAKASLAIKEGGTLEVMLEQGNADIFRMKGSKQKEMQRIAVIPRQKVSLPAPKRAAELSAIDVDWSLADQVSPAANNAPVAKAAPNLRTEPIQIFSPANYTNVTDDKIEFRGRIAEKGGTILINGDPVTLTSDLQFTKNIPLAKGTNSIVIHRITASGESVFRNVVVIRK